jgi:predicted DNA-binding helix-hairpin-helix protein
METIRKLAILADAAKYDASCASSGSGKRDSRASGGIGSTEGMGICHSYTPDGRCVSLLKILLTNFCIYDCAYCVNRVSSNVARARFSVDEVVTLTLDFYKRNYIEGLFLSSGIIRNADYTMEQMVDTATPATSTSRPFPRPRRNCWPVPGAMPTACPSTWNCPPKPA